jgi:hypothetical protein
VKIAKQMFAITCATLMSSAAAAATSQAHSVTYFDEGGHVVGQQILLCSNLGGGYGNVHTAYTIVQYSNCTTPYGPTVPESIVPGKHVTSYTLPSIIDFRTACGYARCDDASVIGLQAFYPIQDYGPWNGS